MQWCYSIMYTTQFPIIATSHIATHAHTVMNILISLVHGFVRVVLTVAQSTSIVKVGVCIAIKVFKRSAVRM